TSRGLGDVYKRQDYIKALKAVLPPEVPVFAVGGVTPENLAQWINAGCVGAGLGSDLYRAGQPVERLSLIHISEPTRR
ncbi:hypothetical protein ELP57_41785, partial [Klebsiella pneumoniae]|nr:hypothetical protein [Klebsiella pneumoniae]